MATPSAGSPRILLLLGGTWHDFDGFGRAFSEWFPRTEITRDLEALARPEGFDVVALFTCLTRENEDGSPSSNILTDAHAQPLAEWVARGGALLALHGATVSGGTSVVFRRLAGGEFVSHPEPFEFTVRPVHVSAFEGSEAFTVHDEFYLQNCADDVTVRMAGIYGGTDHPLAWTREEGRGRVAHIAPGHDERTWNLPAYRRLVARAVAWLINPSSPAAP